MFKRTRNRFTPRTGIWPNGEPQSVRDLADQSGSARCYTVFMVVIGGYDEYQVVAVYEDREAARRKAREYNEANLVDGLIGLCVCVEHYARVEEIACYVDEVTAVWNSISGM